MVYFKLIASLSMDAAMHPCLKTRNRTRRAEEEPLLLKTATQDLMKGVPAQDQNLETKFPPGAADRLGSFVSKVENM